MRDVQLLLEGRQTDLSRSLRQRMEQTAEDQEYERAARYRDQLSTVEQLQEKQRVAAAEGEDVDVFGYQPSDFIDGVEFGGAAAFLAEARRAHVTMFV